MKILMLTDGEYAALVDQVACHTSTRTNLEAASSAEGASLRQKVDDALDMEHGVVMDDGVVKVLRRVLESEAQFLWWNWSSLSEPTKALFDGNQAKFERFSAWVKAA